MSELSRDELWMERLASQAGQADRAAPSTWKARLYSRLVQEQAESGGLATLSQSSKNGFGLCVFEKLVQIAPLGESVEKRNPCRVCHARVLAERMEHAPIYWPHCPYAGFQNH